MTRLLFLPNSNTLIWQELPQTPDELVAAIHSGLWQPPAPFTFLDTAHLSVTRQGDLITISLAEAAEASPPPMQLSRRQLEVLRGLADGLTTRQIASRLEINPRTVFFHVAGLKSRLGAQTRAELISKAVSVLPNTAAPERRR